MRPVKCYKRSYRRFGWNNRIAYGAPVLSRRRNTGKDECGYFSTIAAVESNLRLQCGFVGNLSIRYLKQKLEKVIRTDAEMRKVGKVEQLLKIFINIGVPSESIYNLIIEGQRPVCPMHKISGYKRYAVSQYMHIRVALEKHLRRGPMVAVFWISDNYHRCMKHGSVYRFTGVHITPLEEEEGVVGHQGEARCKRICHSVCVVCFGIEETVPFLMFRTDKAGLPEFGRVEIQSVIELYGINV